MKLISERVIGRISLYRRILSNLRDEREENVFSHRLASLAGLTAAQVRRDLMAVGYNGSPSKGYEVETLLGAIAQFLDDPKGEGAILVGIGNLGRALLSYFSGRRPHLRIAAAFDSDPERVNRVIHGCRCFPFAELERVVTETGARVGVLTVPAAAAQEVAERLVRDGILGIVNFSPVRLRLPREIYVEQMDMTIAMEKVAFFAHRTSRNRKDDQA